VLKADERGITRKGVRLLKRIQSASGNSLVILGQVDMGQPDYP